MTQALLCSLVVALVCWARLGEAKMLHEQVHIGLGTNETEMTVTWSTMSAIPDHAEVLYHRAGHAEALTEPAVETHFKNFYTYRALLRGLQPDTLYEYRVGSNTTGYYKTFTFRTLKTGPSFMPRIAIYGDLGYQNERSLHFLEKDVQDKKYDAIFHIGDMAYNLFERNCEQGHDFMRSIEPVAANVPYMVIPGNHEEHGNFSHYDARFTMIGDRHEPKHDAPLLKRINNHFWSIDIGPAHFLMFSSEFYYYTEYGWEQIEWQYRFIEEDLKRANKNRAQRPWIIAMAHKPFYISDGAHQDKGLELERGELRKGVHMYGDAKRPLQFGLEKLFYDQGVDLEFFGHEHLFARYLPIHNYVFHDSKNGSNPYANSLAPIPIITGSAGCRELPTQFSKHIQPYVVKRNYNYGYTRLHFASDKQIVMEQLSDDLNGKIIDKIEIAKDEPTPAWLRQPHRH